ncbi:MAG: hypothetical protein K5882_00135, partial [Bacteroidales bacterium]|nr:hypothetical protein [Bacteroidales bacterium]
NRLPKEKQMAWNTKGGLQLPVSDTTVFMQALREGKKLVNSEGKKLLPCWLLVSESDSIYQFNLLYGDRSGKPIINGTQVKNVSVQKSTYTGQYEVLMRFDMKTADFWQKFTAENVDNRIGMMLASDRLLSVPQIMCEIAGGACSVSGPTEEECKAIAVILQGDK